jgi:hypothetical protein
MIKKILAITAFLALAGVLIFGAVYRTQARSGGGTSALAGLSTGGLSTGGLGKGGTSHYNSDQTQARPANGELTNLPAADPDGLSAVEAEALLFMREEEKLAQDVYLALYDQWGMAIFKNIAASEQTHTAAILTLLERYGLADPASAQAGVFTNSDLQALYSELVTRGSHSLTEALKAGGAIEEIDILDLQTRLAQTDNPDIVQVFNSLLNGSVNHLRAFANVLSTQTGETYQPQYLSPADFQALVGSSGSGSANGGRGNGRGGGNGGHP